MGPFRRILPGAHGLYHDRGLVQLPRAHEVHEVRDVREAHDVRDVRDVLGLYEVLYEHHAVHRLLVVHRELLAVYLPHGPFVSPLLLVTCRELATPEGLPAGLHAVCEEAPFVLQEGNVPLSGKWHQYQCQRQPVS